MNGNCFDIGTIQAFLDGETTPVVTTRIAEHVGDCQNCSAMLAAAEEENAVVFSILDRDMDILVPTQRLWGRINQSISESNAGVSIWRRAYAFFIFNLANPSPASAFAILLLVGFLAVTWGLFSGSRTVVDNDLNASISNSGEVTDADRTAPPVVIGTTVIGTQSGGESIWKDSFPTTADNSEKRPQTHARYAVYRTAASTAEYLPAEQSYISTIGDLSESFESRKDRLLSPSSRVSFERDLAVVDDAIRKMRVIVKKNPRNQAAKQVLYSSYQDKIDLLSSVAMRDELMASIQ